MPGVTSKDYGTTAMAAAAPISARTTAPKIDAAPPEVLRKQHAGCDRSLRS
jgi:hypothetical protein